MPDKMSAKGRILCGRSDSVSFLLGEFSNDVVSQALDCAAVVHDVGVGRLFAK